MLEPNPRRSPLSWVLIIAIGIILGQLGTELLRNQLLAPQFPHWFGASAAPPPGMNAAQREAWAQNQVRRGDARRSAQENCDFWTLQAERDPTSYHQTMRDAACSRANNL